mmetsp:Transcript_7428/g.12935  ORF Transcript_7428/g.12935 Transcript_7428/m.12935 type:complete len:320 (-) Transcript_7428:364-1323(-)
MSASSSPPTYPQFMENSHDDGSIAALQVFFMFLCMWEILYHAAKYLLKIGLARFPNQILDSSLFNSDNRKHDRNPQSNIDNHTTHSRSPLDDAKHTLLQRGPSYIVSFLHSIYATWRGIMHLYHLWNASNLDKLLIPGKEIIDSYRWAGLHVATTNTLFLSYLVYDLLHILLHYPKLGGVDTIIHHVIFASCSVINGTFGIMPFAFGWLIVGEASTIFLNARWFLLKSGRQTSDLLNKINTLFAATFFLTRIGIYSSGIIHLFYNSLPELRSLPTQTGVPITLVGMTCGCMLLGWALNILWGYKILSIVGGKKNRTKEQ